MRANRIWYVADAFQRVNRRRGISHSKIDPWFLYKIEDIVDQKKVFEGKKL